MVSKKCKIAVENVVQLEQVGLSNTMLEIVVISNFEGFSSRQICSEILSDKKPAYVDALIKKLKQNGAYDKIIEMWRNQSPFLYKRAVEGKVKLRR